MLSLPSFSPSTTCSPFNHRRPSLRFKASQATTSTTRHQAMAAIPPPSLYEVLGLSATANCTEIKAAYRRLARSCHPDVCKGTSSGSADEFMRVHEAYSTLSDPNKRTDYDRGLVLIMMGVQQRQRSTVHTRPSSQPFPSSGRRTWETDQCW